MKKTIQISTDEPHLLSSQFIAELPADKSLTTLYNYSIFIFGSGYNTAKYFKNKFKTQLNYAILNIHHKNQTQTFLPDAVWRAQSSETLLKYLKNPTCIYKIEQDFYKNFPAIDKLYNKYTYKCIDNMTEAALVYEIERAFDLFWTTNARSHFSVYLDLELCFQIAQQAYKDIELKEVSTIWHKATEMIAESFDKAQKRDILLRIINRENNSDLIEHCQYFYTSYKDVLPLKQVETEIKKTYGKFLNNPKLAMAEIKKLDLELKQKTKTFNLWRNKLTSRQKNIVDFCQVVMRVRDRRKNHFAKGITIAWRMAEKIFQTAGVDVSLVKNILPFEELLRGSQFVNQIKKELVLRNKQYALYVPYYGAKQISYCDIKKELKFINPYLLGNHKSQPKELKGQTGNKGLARGVVRIIRSHSQFGAFKKGEILVAGMTRPEYVPLMRLAKAIVTDEGGITCHAAIVSRELDKPCVTGTKFATRLLHDGDQVEVDASAGLVRILNKD